MIDDIKGNRYNRLVAIRPMYIKNHEWFWEFICDCGNTTIKSKSSVKRGSTKSCGCLHTEVAVLNRVTHHKTGTRLYAIWLAIKARCKNKNNATYGGRGIIVCDEWKNSFEKFYTWSMRNGYCEHLTIDRIDNDGNYEPSNCRWVTYEVQANNQRKNKLITYRGKTKTLSTWCKELNTPYHLVYGRIFKLNWKVDDAFCKPKRVFINNSTGDLI